jgi:RHS repeat-associated protein
MMVPAFRVGTLVPTSILRAVAATALLLAAQTLHATNTAPVISSEPEPLSTLDRGFVYAIGASDADGDTLQFALEDGPAEAGIDAESGVLRWSPGHADIGIHPFGIAVDDGQGGVARQHFMLRVVEDFCPIYPLALPASVIDPLQPGARVERLERGTGAGNFSWLSWTGAVDAPTLAQSLLPPGDSYLYRNPVDPGDSLLDIGDWVHAATGSMNAAAVRANLGDLVGEDIVLPVWGEVRGQGSRFQYRVSRFAVVRLEDFRLTGQGWIGFEFRGFKRCYNDPPVAHDQRLETLEDTPLAIELHASDPENDPLDYTIVTPPSHGDLGGEPPQLIYTPHADYHGGDSFTFRANDGEFDSNLATVWIEVLPVNDPPIAYDDAVETDEDVPVAITLRGFDVDGDVLTYTLIELPQHGQLSGTAPQLLYTPDQDFHGSDRLRFVVDDGEYTSAPATVAITVHPVNDPPRFITVPPTHALDGQPYVYAAEAIDPDIGDVLRYVLVSGPVGMQIDAETGLVEWTPTAAQFGAHPVVIEVYDLADASDRQEWVITVERGNLPPQIVSEPVHSVDQGSLYSYDVDAIDPNPGDVLSYSLSHAPGDMQIDAASGLIQWQPDASLVGSNLEPQRFCKRPGVSQTQPPPVADVVVVVDESGSMSGEHAWIADLAAPLEAHLVSNGVGSGDERNRYGLIGYERAPREIPVGGGLMGDYLELEAATRLLRLSGGFEDGWRASRHALIAYPLREQASKNIILITDEGRDNADRDITYASLLEDFQSRGAVLNAVVNARFRCGDNSVALGVAPGGVGYQADGRGGYTTCSGARAVSGSTNTIAAYVNLALETGGAAWDLYEMRAGGVRAQSFSNALLNVKVREILEHTPPTAQADLVVYEIVAADHGPVRVEIGNRGLADYGQAFAVELFADGNALGRIEIPALAAGEQQLLDFDWPRDGADPEHLEARIDAASGLECGSDNNQLRVRWVRAEVTDQGGLSDSQGFSIGVADVNSAPRIISTPPTSASIGSRYVYALQIEDPDLGDGHEYLLLAGPTGFTVDPLAGRASFLADAGQAGEHPISIAVRDLAGAEDVQHYTLQVDSTYLPPRFESIAPRRAVQGTLYEYATAVSADASATLSYDVFTGPPGLAIDSDGVVRWQVPENWYKQTARVLLRVFDQFGNYDLQMYILVGDLPNAAPRISSTPPASAQIGVAHVYGPSVLDPNVLEEFSWRLLAAPSGAVVNADTGGVDWPAAAVDSTVPAAEVSAVNSQCRLFDPDVGASVALSSFATIGYAKPIGQVLLGPLADTNFDGRLDHRDALGLVAISQRDADVTTARIHAFDPRSRGRYWSFDERTPNWLIAPAMGALTGGTDVSILFVDTAGHLVALDGEGRMRWASEAVIGPGTRNHNAISLADLEGDGRAEILIGPSVFDADGQLLWQFPQTGGSQSHALALDLDGDGTMEVLYRDQVRSARGELLWTTPSSRNTTVQYAFFAPARLTADGSLQLVVSEQTSAGARLSALAADGTLLWELRNPETGFAGPPLVADFSGDGIDEIFLPATGRMYSASGEREWTVSGVSWNTTAFRSAIAADLDGDGRMEIVALSSNGTTILSPDGSARAVETGQGAGGAFGQLPLLVDPFATGAARLIVGGTQGIREYLPIRGQWRSDARVFPQHAWARDRVRADLAVPAAVAGVAPAPLMQLIDAADVAQPTVYLSDLHVGSLRARPVSGAMQVEARVTNRGTAASLPYTLEFHRGTPAAPAGLIASRSGAALASGANTLFTVGGLDRAELGDDEMHAIVVPHADELECETGNNAASGRGFELEVTDHGGLTDSQRWVVGVIEPRFTPEIASLPPTAAIEGETYRYAIAASSGHIGDALTYTLGTAPVGARIDAELGRIEWTPRWGQTGRFRFTATVRSQTNRTRSQTWDVDVAASQLPNTPPVFVSEPVLHASIGEIYRYQVEAIDAEGHEIEYALAQSPNGMQIDPLTGSIHWIPSSASSGVPVTVTATDERGAVAEQAFSIAVHTLPNRAPSIDSTPLTIAYVGEPWEYELAASDPDGDPLRWLLNVAPDGMTLDEAAERLDFVADASQLGPHAVEVQVIDGRGGYAIQRFELRVYSVDAGNQPPSLSGTPPSPAVVGQLWTYQPEASDPNGDTLSFSLIASPVGMLIDSASGRVDWTPSAGQIGTHAVGIRVDDGRGGWATQRFDLPVVAAGGNTPPVIISTPPEAIDLGDSLHYPLIANDADGDRLSYRLDTAPDGMAIDAASGLITWTPRPEQLGTHPVEAVVDDGRGGIARQAFDLLVREYTGPNRAPTIVRMPFPQAKVGRLYRDRVDAFDADGDVLIYTLVDPPAGMGIDPASGMVEWLPDADGVVTLTARVSDGIDAAERSIELRVHAAAVPLTAALTANPQVVAPGDGVTLSLVVDGAAGPVNVDADLDGQPIVLVVDGSVVIAAPSAPGSKTASARVDDGYEIAEASDSFFVGDPDDTAPPTVRLLTPVEHPDHDAIELSAPTPVSAEVLGSNVNRWILAVRERGSSSFRTLAEGTAGFAATEIAQFDPTLLLNGQYTLILQAWTTTGQTAVDSRIVAVTGDMKIGHFSISFEEVSIPVAGIPVTVTRTYDTRRAHQSLDFGHGWTVDTRSMRIHESRTIGFGWGLLEYRQGFFSTWCVKPNGDPIVSVTMPDGDIATFRARAEPECTQLVPQVNVRLAFEPVGSTKGAQLAQTDYGQLRAANLGDAWHLIDLGEPDRPVDPNNYRLTTADGMVYDVNQQTGLRRVTEPASGHTLTWTAAGVRHSTGVGIDFIRDPQGRITELVLPDQTTIGYSYSPAGDLVTVTDQVEQDTSFGYDPRIPHYLRDIIDARGIRVARNEYDDDGRLVATIDADGNRVEFSRDIAGRVETVKDRRGNSTVYVYDERGRVLAETNVALGETITRSYDMSGNQLSETNAENETTSWTYDPRGNRLTETNHANETTTWTYNARSQLLTEVDDAGRAVVTNTYDVRTGVLLTASADALGQLTTFSYVGGTGIFGTGELESIRTAENAITSFTYHPMTGFKTSETDALGNTTAYVNDDAGRVLRQTRTRTRADGSTEQLITRYRYDDKGRLLEVTHPDNSVTTTEYDAGDRPTRECDALQRCTVSTYGPRGELERVDYHDGSFELKTYDRNGNLETQTDRGGRTTRFVYDAANRLIETIHPDADADDGNDANNPRTFNRYDAAGRLVETIDENDRSTLYQYDAAGRRTRTIITAVDTAPEAVIETEYDRSGRRTATIDAEGHRTEYRYDDAGRLLETIHPDDTPHDDSDNPRSRIEYDRDGRKIADIDEEGRITRYGFDALGRLTVVVLPDPATGANPPLVGGASPDAGTLTTRYVYDEVGNKREQIDAEGRVTRWEYDSMGRELARILPEGQRETRSYNAAGELVTHTDFNGNTTTYHYDAAGQLERIEYPTDADVQFRYNAVGERTHAIDARGTSTRSNDRRGRLVQAIDADGGIIEYEYDDAGNLLARVSPSQSLVYTYDARHRLQTVTRSVDGEAPTVTRYAYDQAGRRTAMEGGDGTRTEYRYDRRHRLRELIKHSAAGALLVAMAYDVDASGMRTGVEELDPAGTTRTVEYQYDAVKRLTREVIDHRDPANSRISAWTYDRVGNRLVQQVTTGGATATTAYSYDRNDRLLTETLDGSTTTYNYDDNGNTIGKQGADGAVSYAYDDANRLIEAITADGVTSYVYDVDGLRVRKTHTPTGGTPTTTWYVQDTNYAYAQSVETWTSEGSGAKRLEATFAFADDLVSQTRYDDAGNPSTSFVQMDGFGSTRWLTDAAGSITDAVDYDAFGNEIDRSGTTEIEHLYRGEAFDPNLGFYYLRARWMDPSIGRFTQMDPFIGRLVDPLSRHRYQYAHLNPVMNSDPSGLETLVGLNSGISVNATLSMSAVRGTAQVTVNNVAGKAFERYVGTLLQRFVSQHGGRVFPQVRFSGPGGVRVADYVVQLGNRFVVVEAKTKIPLGGQALVRLGGQLRTFSQGATKVVPGKATEVIVITEETAAALQASFLTIESQVATGTISGILQGTNGLMTVLRGLLVL